MRESALELGHPCGCSLELIGSLDVVHEEAIDVFDQSLTVEVGGEKVTVARCDTTISTDKEVPAFFSGDDSEIFAASFRTFSSTAGYTTL